MKAIYKIENKINHKIYIGESKNPKRRWKEHIDGKNNNSVSLIHRAISKYGVENFDFTILEWTEYWAEREQYWIKYYRSLAPHGYNIHKGGGEPPIKIGEDNPNAFITNEVAHLIQKDLLDYDIPRKQIVKKFKITENIIRHINEGSSWYDENLIYPIRPQEKVINSYRVNLVKDLLINTTLTQKEIGQKVGWNRSAVTMINIGKNHYDETLNYPIRGNNKKYKNIIMKDANSKVVIKEFKNLYEAAIYLKDNNICSNYLLGHQEIIKSIKNSHIVFGYQWEIIY